MKPSTLLLTTLISLTSSTLAQQGPTTACTASTAEVLPSSASDCNGNPACLAIAEEGQNNASDLISSDDDTTTSSDDTTSSSDSDASDLIKRSTPRKRVISNLKSVISNLKVDIIEDFRCEQGYTCYSYQSTLLCLDMSTGAFQDNTGGFGNALSGEYYGPEVISQGGGTAGASGTSTADSYGPAETTLATSVSQTGSGSGSSTASASAEAANSTGGAGMVRAGWSMGVGAALGAVALVL